MTGRDPRLANPTLLYLAGLRARRRQQQPPSWDAVALLRQAGIEPDPWQVDVAQSHADRIILNCCRQSGKALHIATEIPTPTGWTTMEALQPGDEVYDEQGHPCRVSWVSPIEQREVWKVRFSDGSSILADAEHLWTTLDGATRAALSRTLGDIPKEWASWQSVGRPRRGLCAFEGCQRSSARQGLCSSHAWQHRQGRPLTPIDPLSFRSRPVQQCQVGACEQPAIARGLCSGHRQQHQAGLPFTPLSYACPRAQTLTTIAMLGTLYRPYQRHGIPGQDTNHAIPATAPLAVMPISLPIDPYTLGVWLGDGTAATNTVTLSDADAEIFEFIRAAGYSVSCRRDQGTTSRWLISGLRPQLRQAGLLGNKHIPSPYLRGTPAQRLALLQGLMDTDGTTSSHSYASQCEFTTTSSRLAIQIYELLVSLGVVVRMKESDAKLYGRVVSRRWRLLFTPWMQVFRLRRKAAKLQFDGPRKGLRKLRFVVGMEPHGVAPVRCIAVTSPSQLYLAGRAMIPTHNSTLTAALALETAFREPAALVLILSPSLRQSVESFRKVLDLYRTCAGPIPVSAESALRLELTNASRIVSLPGKEGTVRGYSKVRLLIVDEAARVDDALYYAVRPMLSVGQGRLVLLSSPFGRRGFFHKEWSEGEGWEKVEVNAYECRRIAADFLEEERRTLPPLWFRSEYLCEFTETVDAVFASEFVYGALSTEVQPLF